MRLKSIFLGNNIPQLEALLQNSDVKAIFTRDDPGNQVFESIFKIAMDNKVSFYTPATMKREKYEMPYNEIHRRNPDIIISAGYHLLVPRYIIDIPTYGTFNIHPAPLPEYRGQHVLQWQLINDEKKTGTTVHRMDASFDTGDIVKYSSTPITEEDDAYTLWKKTSDIGAGLLEQLLSEISEGKTVESYNQDESKAVHYNKRRFEDGKIDWNKSSRQIYNLSRALVHPWPGAYFELGKKIYRLDRTSYIDDHTNIPGFIIEKDNGNIAIGTGDGRVIINKDNIRDYDGNLDEFARGTYLN